MCIMHSIFFIFINRYFLSVPHLYELSGYHRLINAALYLILLLYLPRVQSKCTVPTSRIYIILTSYRNRGYFLLSDRNSSPLRGGFGSTSATPKPLLLPIVIYNCIYIYTIGNRYITYNTIQNWT